MAPSCSFMGSFPIVNTTTRSVVPAGPQKGAWHGFGCRGCLLEHPTLDPGAFQGKLAPFASGGQVLATTSRTAGPSWGERDGTSLRRRLHPGLPNHLGPPLRGTPQPPGPRSPPPRLLPQPPEEGLPPAAPPPYPSRRPPAGLPGRAGRGAPGGRSEGPSGEQRHEEGGQQPPSPPRGHRGSAEPPSPLPPARPGRSHPPSVSSHDRRGERAGGPPFSLPPLRPSRAGARWRGSGSACGRWGCSSGPARCGCCPPCWPPPCCWGCCWAPPPPPCSAAAPWGRAGGERYGEAGRGKGAPEGLGSNRGKDFKRLWEGPRSAAGPARRGKHRWAPVRHRIGVGLTPDRLRAGGVTRDTPL